MSSRTPRRDAVRPVAVVAASVLALAGALVGVSSAAAATITVTSSADSGAGSLRAVVAGAASGDMIQFDPAVTSIALASTITLPVGVTLDGGSHLVITPAVGITALTIAPTAAAQNYTIENVELAGAGTSRGLLVQNGTGPAHDMTLSHVSVHGFTNTEGSGIDVRSIAGTFTIDSSTLEGNTATDVGGSALRYTAPSGVALVISNSTVSGNQSTSTTVVADGAVSIEGSPAATITLSGDTFAGNQAGGHSPPPYNLVFGGAVSLGNDDGSSGALTVVDTRFTGNGVGDGTHGNVYYGGALRASRPASLTMTNTVFQGNAARDDGSAVAIDNMGGPITLTGVTVNGGSFHDGGGTGVGGIFFANNTGITTISGLAASGNAGGDGSVLDIRSQSGPFTVSGSDIESNTSERGAIYFESIDAAVTIGTSTFRLNSSTADGAADITAADISAGGSLTVSRSTFSQSSASGGTSGLAIYAPTETGVLTISESTFDEPAAVPVIQVDGVNGTFALANSTIVSGQGVELGVIDGTLARVSHTIIQVPARAAALTVGAAGRGPALDVRWSLLSSGLGPRQTDTVGNKLNTDAQLATLANNGGPTQTMLPQTGSAAIDAGDPAFSDPVTVDQRGLSRIVRIIDIGAVEVQAAAVLPATGEPIGGGLIVALLLVLLGGVALAARHRLS